MSDIIKINSLIKSLLEELKKLNENLSEKKSDNELPMHSSVFLYGLNSNSKVEPEFYRKYVAFSNNVSDVLQEFGISASNNGYTYIIDAVKLIIDQNSIDIKLSDDIYPLIKQKHKLNSSATVEHSIRNAIKSAWIKCTINAMVCRMDSYIKKPTNKEFLYTVTQDVCSRMNKDLGL